MRWLLIVLVPVAIVAALLVMRRRDALGSDPSAAAFTADKRNKDVLSDPNTGLGMGQGPPV